MFLLARHDQPSERVHRISSMSFSFGHFVVVFVSGWKDKIFPEANDWLLLLVNDLVSFFEG